MKIEDLNLFELSVQELTELQTKVTLLIKQKNRGINEAPMPLYLEMFYATMTHLLRKNSSSKFPETASLIVPNTVMYKQLLGAYDFCESVFARIFKKTKHTKILRYRFYFFFWYLVVAYLEKVQAPLFLKTLLANHEKFDLQFQQNMPYSYDDESSISAILSQVVYLEEWKKF